MPWPFSSGRREVIKDNPQPLLPLPATAAAGFDNRRRTRRVRPAVLGLIAGLAFILVWKFELMDKLNDIPGLASLLGSKAQSNDAPSSVEDTEEKLDPELAKYSVDYRVHTFYYSWYGEPKNNNNKWVHWNHRVLVDNGTNYKPPESIGSTYWPKLGPYSSTSPETVKQHFKWIRQAGIGTVCLTWWGSQESDENGERGMTDAVLPLLFKTAKQTGLKLSFHIEPYPGRTAKTVESDIQDLLKRFEMWGSILEPVFFVYDSYLIASDQWASVLKPGTPLRNHPSKPVILGLIVQQADMASVAASKFDGGYTYFASHSFVWGSNPDNWAAIATWAAQNKLKYVPCVGPGYDDERIRPWNSRNTRSREGGLYYDRGWTSIVRLDPKPDYIGQTSWNEWHEGTQIEPATRHVGGDGHKYPDYEADNDNEGPAEEVYLRRTRKWIERWAEGGVEVRSAE